MPKSGGRHYSFAQDDDGSFLNTFWVLLDNQLTIKIFYNDKLLVGIQAINTPIKIPLGWSSLARIIPSWGRWFKSMLVFLCHFRPLPLTWWIVSYCRYELVWIVRVE